MYTVKRSGRKVPKSLAVTFYSYESARSAVRAYLRKALKKDKVIVRYNDRGWAWHSNPSISSYGFKIVPV